mmetsp:Transcript_24986/g.60361  ORF Transcript_24986/g.60361 Transcript_24986/m.60361 type:complete len:265 (+) Transcript_24986:180-974(+)
MIMYDSTSLHRRRAPPGCDHRAQFLRLAIHLTARSFHAVIWPTAALMPNALASTPLMSLGLSGTITILELRAISASWLTYISATRCPIAALPPFSSKAAPSSRIALACASALITSASANPLASSAVDSLIARERASCASAWPCASILACCALASAAMRTAFAFPRAAVSACRASAAATAPDASDMVSFASDGIAEIILMLMISTPYVRVTRLACSTDELIFCSLYIGLSTNFFTSCCSSLFTSTPATVFTEVPAAAADMWNDSE